MKNKSAVVLLSGGLDSVVSLAEILNLGCDVKLALTFDYGQKSFKNENTSSARVCEYYGIEHKVIKLDWLKAVTNTSLVSEKNVPAVEKEKLDDKQITEDSMKNVWVPNRNGLFINIAGSFCDSFSYDYIVIGANKEEAATFSDNSIEFIDNINKSLEYSTNYNVKVLAPLINYSKSEIVRRAVEMNTPLQLINSCYNDVDKHCGNCESCNRLRRALESNERYDIIKALFNQ